MHLLNNIITRNYALPCHSIFTWHCQAWRVISMYRFSMLEWVDSALEGHDDVIKWSHFPRYWPFVRGIHWSPVNSLHKGQWRGALMFSLICTWTNSWANNHYQCTSGMISLNSVVFDCQTRQWILYCYMKSECHNCQTELNNLCYIRPFCCNFITWSPYWIPIKTGSLMINEIMSESWFL